MPKKQSLPQYLRSCLACREERLEQTLRAVKEAKEYLSSGKRTLTFRVSLTSLWADKGEKAVTLEKKAPLEELITLAVKEFLQVNNRKDIQANWGVEVILPSDYAISLPEELWKDLTGGYYT